jgi:hypothetical protein
VKISTTWLALTASGCFALIGVGALSQTADGAAKPQEQDQTYQMYANVDAEGDLGSNHDAVRVKLDAGTHIYTVKFAHEISHCAASVQPGRAGGSDPVKAASSVLAQGGPKVFLARFTDPDGNIINDPFMLTVTCVR